MLRELYTAARRAVSPLDAAVTVVALAVVYANTNDPAVTLGTFAGFLLLGLYDTLKSVPTVDERWLKLGLGTLAATGGAAMLWLAWPEPTAALVFPGVLTLCGLWIVLDARADFAEGRRLDAGDPDDLGSGEAMLVMHHLRLVGDELEDGPRTVPELADACDLTESRVRQALDLVRDGTIYQVDADGEQPRYALDERKVGLGGLGWKAAGGLRWLAGRLARPLRPVVTRRR